jgi:hypothetical protein
MAKRRLIAATFAAAKDRAGARGPASCCSSPDIRHLLLPSLRRSGRPHAEHPDSSSGGVDHILVFSPTAA